MFSGSCTQIQDRQPNHPISSRLSLTQGLAEQIHQIHLKCLGGGKKSYHKQSYFG